MAKINCENKNSKRPIDLSKIERVAGAALRRLNRKKAEVNIVFVSNQKIRAMNRRYRGTDKSTDVLAFPPREWPPPRWPLPRCEQSGFLGDIVVSSDEARKNAKEYDTSFVEEAALYVIHGILHLTGHEDRTEKGRVSMQRLENELIRKIRKFL